MLTLNIGSNLASPLSGNVTIEINSRAPVKEILNNYLIAMERNGYVPGLAVFDKHWNKLDWNVPIEDLGIKEGARLYIGYDKNRSVRPLRIAAVGIFIIVIGILLLIVATVLFGATGGNEPYDYGIVIDAGSTHTEVFLYQWTGKKDHGTGVVHQKDSCEYEVGIASEFDPAKIVSCVNNVSSVIPAGVSRPRLYLAATGGMRLLNLTSPKVAHLILMALRYALQASSVQVETVDIISGEDEAVSSWISINFLTETLNQAMAKDTYGALDLGGASTQYAFEVNDRMKMNFSNIKDLKLYGDQYSVSSESFLCFGYFEVMDRTESVIIMEFYHYGHEDHVLDDIRVAYEVFVVSGDDSVKSIKKISNKGSAKIDDPCLPKGFIRILEAEYFSQKPCVHNKNFTVWLQNDLNIIEFIVTGSGNYSECKKNVEQILDENVCKFLGFSQCLHANNLAKSNVKFMAFSGFYYVVDFLNASQSLDKFVNATIDLCGLTWDEIQKAQPKSLLEHISRYCFAAVYINELLTSKYGFDSSTWKNLIFTKEIKGEDVGWTLGFMIDASNSIPEEYITSPVISLSVFLPLVFISIIMVYVGILLLRTHIKHYFSFPYEESLKV